MMKSIYCSNKQTHIHKLQYISSDSAAVILLCSYTTFYDLFMEISMANVYDSFFFFSFFYINQVVFLFFPKKELLCSPRLRLFNQNSKTVIL